MKRIEKVAYRLEFPSSCLIHPVFHVLQLKKAPRADSPTTLVPPIAADMQGLTQLQEILQVRGLDGCRTFGGFGSVGRKAQVRCNREDMLKCQLLTPTLTLRTRWYLWGGYCHASYEAETTDYI